MLISSQSGTVINHGQHGSMPQGPEVYMPQEGGSTLFDTASSTETIDPRVISDPATLVDEPEPVDNSYNGLQPAVPISAGTLHRDTQVVELSQHKEELLKTVQEALTIVRNTNAKHERCVAELEDEY